MSTMTLSIAPAQGRLPYPGLRPFLLEEADIFFGREEQVRQILERLNRGRFLALVGTSGCGKSSLARAGLTAALEAGFMVKAGARWRVVTMRPGIQPFNNLADAMLEPGVLGADGPPADALPPPGGGGHELKPFLLATLRRGPSGLAEFLGEPLTAGAGPALPQGENLLLVVDQFEEIFRFWRVGDRNEADAFIALLLDTARQEKLPVYVVLTMRSDYLGDCAIFNGLPEALNDSQFLTPRLTRQQRRKAIEGPARVFGGQVEPALVGRLLNEMGSEPNQLPLMQHVLMRLWSRARLAPTAGPETAGGEVILRLEQYETLGKLTEALDRHAEEVYTKELGPEQQRIAEVLFRCLSERDVSGGLAASHDTRRPMPLKGIAAVAGATAAQVAAVADIFRAAGVNFLTPAPEVPLTPESVLDITHESLLRRWKRLRDWVDAEAKSADTYRRLEENAREWAADRAGLMKDKLKLNHTLDWMKRERPTAAWARRYGKEEDFDLALRFLDESDRAQKDHAAAREREKKYKRGVRIVIVALVFAAVVLSLLSGIFYWQSQAEHAAAQLTTKEGELKVKEGELKVKEGELKVKILKEETKSAESKALNETTIRLSLQSGYLLSTNPVSSLFLSRQALSLASRVGDDQQLTLTANDAFRKALANIGGRGYGAGQGKITNVAASEDSKGNMRWIASGGQDGTIVLWDTHEDQPGGKPIHLIGYQAAIKRLRFTRKTGWLMAQSWSGQKYLVTLWKLNDPKWACKVAEGYQNFYVSRDENWLLTYEPGRARLFDLRSEDPTSEPVEVKSDTKSFNIRFISFTDKGNLLAVISKEGDAFLCDLKALRGKSDVDAVMLKVGATPGSQAPKDRVVKNGEFTDNGDKLVVFFSDGRVRVWKREAGGWNEPGTDERLRTPFKDGEEVMVVTDVRGLRAVVARKSVTVASDPSQSILTAQAGTGSAANDKSVAYLFDGNDLDRPIALRGFDDSVDWSKYIQVDEHMGRLAAACRQPEDGIRVWDLRGSKPDVSISPIAAKPGLEVLSWTLASNGRWLITRGLENSVRLWDMLPSGQLPSPANLRGHDGNATVFAFSEDNHFLVTGAMDGTLRSWNLTAVSPSTEPAILHNAAAPRSVLVAPTKRWFAMADVGIVRLWYIDKSYLPYPLKMPVVQGNHMPPLSASEDGRWLAATYPKGNDIEAVLWDTDANGGPSQYCRLGDVQGELHNFHVSPDGRGGYWIAATVLKNSAFSAQLWREQAMGNVGAGGKFSQPVPWECHDYVQGFAAGGKALLTNTGGLFRLWKLGEPIEEFPFPSQEQGSLQAAKLTPDGNLLVAKVGSVPAKLFDLSLLATNKTPPPKRLDGWPGFDPTSTFVSANSRWLCAVSPEKTFLCWDLTSTNLDIKPLDFKASKKGKEIAEDNQLQQAENAGDKMNTFLPSSDRRWLVTNEGVNFHLWDLASQPGGKARDVDGEKLRPNRWPLAQNVSNVVFSPDSSWLLTADNNQIHLYSLDAAAKDANLVKEPKFKRPAESRPGQIKVAAVSRTGRWLAVTGPQDSAIRVWDLDGGKGAEPLVLTNRVALNSTELFITPERLFSVDKLHSTIQISRVTAEELLKVAALVVGRNPSQKEWTKLEMPRPYQPIFPDLPKPQLGPDLDAPGLPDKHSAPNAELPLSDGFGQIHGRLIWEGIADASPLARLSKVYTVQMQKDKVYQIDLHSSKFDTFLRLETADKELQSDHRGGGETNARIVFRCRTTAIYRVIATSFNTGFNTKLGEFTLTVQSR